MYSEIRYITDEAGHKTEVILPIELWKEIESERETAYLLKSRSMEKRLTESMNRKEGIPMEEMREKLGI
jgi:hypothetical protein